MLRMVHLFLRLIHGDISASISFYCSIPSISIISPVSILSITITHQRYFHNTSTEVFSQNLDSDSGDFTSHSCSRNYRGSISSVAVQADVGSRAGSCQLEKIGVELQAVHWTKSLAKQTFMVTNLVQCPVLHPCTPGSLSQAVHRYLLTSRPGCKHRCSGMNIKGYGRLPCLDSAQAGLPSHVPNLDNPISASSEKP